MLKYILSRRLVERGLYGIVLCVLSFLGGQFILNKISTMEDPPFGNTIYILIGNLFVFGSLLGFFVLLKYMYDENKKEKRKVKKRKSHKIYYLKNKENETSENNIEK